MDIFWKIFCTICFLGLYWLRYFNVESKVCLTQKHFIPRWKFSLPSLPVTFSTVTVLPEKVLTDLHDKPVKFPADLVAFTEEILNGKLYFLCSVRLIFVLCPGYNNAFIKQFFGLRKILRNCKLINKMKKNTAVTIY